MALFAQALPPSAFFTATKAWRMSFQSVHFLLFLPVAAAVYFLLPARLRKGWLLASSYYFYLFAAPDYLVVLLAGTLFSYIAARLMAAARTRRGKAAFLWLGIGGLALSLTFFKYNDFFAAFLSPLLQGLGFAWPEKYFIATKAAGISFYTFTSIGYLADVYSGTAPPEKNLVSHALFLGFFPAVTSGPISRAGDLLPQLNDTARRFDPALAADGLRCMAIGYFKKMAVADTLGIFVSAVYGDNLAAYSGLTLVAANLAYMLRLYFDFSGYTDIALGTARLFGIRLPQNFNTPYFATNFSSFWSRWHITLSCWLQDYIFTPLVWSRWPEKIPVLGRRVSGPPVLSSIAVVFLVSGVWHGDSLCFVVWGALQAVFRVGEELLHRFAGKPKKRLSRLQRAGKTAVVLFLWMQSLVFFQVGNLKNGTVGMALAALGRQWRAVSPRALGNTLYAAVSSGVYNHPVIIRAFFAFSLFCLLAAMGADWLQFSRLKGRPLSEGLAALPAGKKWAVYYLLALCCFGAFLLQSGGFGGASFIYGGF